MPINYQQLAKSIALRANQLADANTAAEFETTYATTSLADAMDGLDLPVSALKADILAKEIEIAVMIGNSTNNLLRRAIAGQAVVYDGADLPRTSAENTYFVGKIDGLFGSTSGSPLEPAKSETLNRRRRNSGSFFRGATEGYAIEGTKILLSTADGEDVYVRGCVFNSTAAAAAWAAGNSVLPEEVRSLWMYMVLEGLAQENWFNQPASQYGNLVASEAQRLGLIISVGEVSDAVTTNTENKNAESIQG